MTPQSHVLGVDFGTTNSYFCKCPSNQISPTGMDFRLGQDGLPSAVLYRDRGDPLVGYEALAEWGNATDQVRRTYRLRTHFKPDIGSNKEAEEAAQAFLEGVIQLDASRAIAGSPDHEVIFGIPSEAGNEFKATLVEIARRAGYGSIQTKDEPIAALVYHLWQKDLSPSDAHKGVLVIDFGGGTCDFAYMLRLDVRHSWGDMSLGGRLFDDLFFQWFLDENPQAVEVMSQSRAEYYVHWYECREMKERFSETMARSREETFRKRIGSYGAVTGLTWEAFVDRATSYRPSESFVRYLREVGEPAEKLTDDDQQIDLLEWFRSSLSNGLGKSKIDRSDISRVILAGGSALWPFVREIVCDVLDMDPSNVLRTERPYAVVASGLAILPAFQEEFRQKQDRLRKQKAEFLKDAVISLVDRRVEAISDRIVQDITVHLYDGEIRTILKRFREQGGAIAHVKRDISTAVQGSDGAIREIAERHMALLREGLPLELQKRVSDWFGREGLHYDPKKTRIQAMETLGNIEMDEPNLFDQMTTGVTTLAALVTAGVVGTIAGGAGIALIMTGPIGWIIGAILGFLGMFVGIEAIREWLESKELPGGLVKNLLSESKMTEMLKEGREKFRDTIRDQVGACSEKPVQELLGKIEQNIDREIDCLTAIDQI